VAKCELCGNTIIGPSRYVIIEGSRMMTCSECAKYSSGEWKPDTIQRQRPPVPQQARRTLMRPAPDTSLKEEALRVRPAYSSIIKEARVHTGWSLEQLASKVGLKESQVRKFESGKLVPSLKEAKVFEHVLQISLISTAETGEGLKGSKPEALTIGDVIDFEDKAG
jgi:putative transcription factor